MPAPTSDDNLLGFRVAALHRDVADSYLDQSNLFKELNKLSAKDKRRAAARFDQRSGDGGLHTGPIDSALKAVQASILAGDDSPEAS